MGKVKNGHFKMSKMEKWENTFEKKKKMKK